MKNIIKRFVDDYKAILDIRKIYNYNNFTFKTIKNVVIFIAIQCFLFIGVGYIFNLLENLHYIFISTNIVIVGSFVIYKFSKELQFKNHYNLKYKVIIPIIYDILYLVTVLLITNELLTVMLFRKVISTAYTITILVVSIFLLIVYFIIDGDNYFANIKEKYNLQRTNILWMIIVITTENIILLYALDIKSIVLSYIVATFTVIIVNILKQTSFIKNMFNNNLTNYLIFVLVVLSSLTLFRTNNHDNYSQGDFISGEIIETNELVITLDSKCVFDKGPHACFDFFASDEHLYITYDDTLYQYDNNLNLLKTYEPPFSDLVKYYVYDYQVYAIQLDESVPDSREYIRYGRRHVAYNITDPNNIIQLNAFYADDDWFDKDVVFYDNHFETTRAILGTVEDNTVIYQDNDRFVFYIDETTYIQAYLSEIDSGFSIYSNSYLCYDEFFKPEGSTDYSTKIILYKTGDYIEDPRNSESQEIIIDKQYYSFDDFHYDGEYFYFTYSNEVFIYDSNLNFVNHLIMNEEINPQGEYESIYISNAGAFSVNMDRISSYDEDRIYTIKSLDIDSLSSQVVTAESQLFTSTTLYMFFGIILLFKIDFPYHKRGESNE